MAIVNIDGVSLSFGGAPLLDQVSLTIEEGDRISLVGRNGTGKSTLLRLLHGDLAPDAGMIRHHKDVSIAFLPQEVPVDMAGSVIDAVETAAFKARHAAAHSEDHGHRVVGRILSQLGVDPQAECATLSGGQKRRVLLARALVLEPDVLLLDEPTNHLDIDSICWMETFLLRHVKTLLFVTHDRAFLRRVANRIVDLDRGKLADWACDYDTFLRRKADLLHDEGVIGIGRRERALLQRIKALHRIVQDVHDPNLHAGNRVLPGFQHFSCFGIRIVKRFAVIKTPALLFFIEFVALAFWWQKRGDAKPDAKSKEIPISAYGRPLVKKA